jgi:hypothetical protein
MTEQEEAAYLALMKAAKTVCLSHTVAGYIPEPLRTAIYELGKAHDAVLDARDAAEQGGASPGPR